MADKSESPEMMARVFIPKLNVKKTVKLNPTETVWTIKKQFWTKLGLTIDETMNYGIYLPKAGVYLEEQRTLASYYFSDNVYFEFKKKQKEHSIPEKQVAKMNIPKNQKQFAEYVMDRQYNKMRNMVSKAFDPNFNMDNGETPLSTAAFYDDVDGVVALVTEMGAYVDYRATDGKTPLHKAAIAGNLAPLQLLLKYGSSSTYRDRNNLTALYDAAANGKTSCVQALLEANSPINVVDSGYRTELHQACSKGVPEVVDLLIEYGADFNAVNEPGNTPLHMCASKNQLECAKALLKNGANKDILNKAGNTAYQLAVMFNHDQVAQFIMNFNGPIVERRKRKHDVMFDSDPGPNDYIPPPPPMGFEGIHEAPKRAPPRRKIFSLLPPPPPPSSQADDMDSGDVSDTVSLPSVVDLRYLPPPPNQPLPPPPAQLPKRN